MSAGGLDPDSEWDDSFEAFAAGRLQAPEDLTAGCRALQNTIGDNPLEHCTNKGALLPQTDGTTLHQTFTKFGFEAHKATSQASSTNTFHFDTFAQFLETIPEHTSFESDHRALSPNSLKLAASAETNQAISTTNTNSITDTYRDQAPHHTSSVKLNSNSPDPSSSGLGSSAEEDFLSCLSYSDKFSASSSEDAETQNFESDILTFEKSSVSMAAKNFKPSESEDDVMDKSNDLSLVDTDQHTFIQRRDVDEKIGLNVSEGSLALQSPMLTCQHPITAGETPTPKLSEPQPKSSVSSQSEKENGGKEGEFNRPLEDFSKVLNDNPSDLMITLNPDDEFYSIYPSVHIITSSPDVKQSLWNSPEDGTTLGEQGASRRSPIPFGLFGDFPNASRIVNLQGFDDTLLHTLVTDQNTSSLLQSLSYVSTDSQDYQTCASHPPSKCSSASEPNETLHSANSTLRGELSDSQMTAAAAASGQENFTDADQPSNEEINQTEQPQAVENSATSVTIADEVATMDSHIRYNPKELTEEGGDSRQEVLGGVFSKCPRAQTLHRSQSEGTLTSAFDERLLPSFGSDPGAVQEESSSPDLPSLTSFVPPLACDSSSSPVVLCSLPPFANAMARSPPSTARAAAPKPVPQESQQQQAAKQQNR